VYQPVCRHCDQEAIQLEASASVPLDASAVEDVILLSWDRQLLSGDVWYACSACGQRSQNPQSLIHWRSSHST
jgi:hypothetical protein